MRKNKTFEYIHLDILDFAEQMDKIVLAMKYAHKLRFMDTQQGIRLLIQEGFTKIEAEKAMEKLSSKQSSVYKELTLDQKRRALREKY